MLNFCDFPQDLLQNLFLPQETLSDSPLNAVDFLQMRLDISDAHAPGIHRYNLLIQKSQVGLVFLDDRGIEFTIYTDYLTLPIFHI